MCSGKELSDEQIENYLRVVNEKGDYKTEAEKLFGSNIIGKQIEEEIKKYNLLEFKKEKRAEGEQNPVSITITLPEMEGEENETK